MARATKTAYVVAREAIVVNVGGKPAVYGKVTVTDRRTQQRVTIPDTDSPPLEEEEVGIAYAFKERQKVPTDHPAVAACPGAFIPLDQAEAEDELLPT